MCDISIWLGLRIRELRSEHKMSQEELAFKSGISPAHLGQIERATKNPTIITISRIAAALEISVSDLFANSTVATSSQSTINEKIIAQLAGMSEDEKKDILKIIRIFRNYGSKNADSTEQKSIQTNTQNSQK